MKLSSYLDENLIFENIKGNNIDEVIHDIISKVSENDENIDLHKVAIENAVIGREHEVSTAMGKGIAIPHARVDEYNDVSVIVAKLENYIENEITALHTLDKTDLVFMIIAEKTKNGTVLRLMSAISRLAMKDEALARIREESNPKHIIKIIKNYEVEVKDCITAEDIMCKDLVPAKLTDTLEEIAKRLVFENRAGLPVVDNKGNFVGEITEKELIEFGMPKYTALINDLSFMTVGEPFEEYFKNESRVTVEELYRKNPKTAERKTPIMEISFLMISKGNTRIYVVEDGKYYGTIFRSDIIKKVLHI